MDLTKELIHRFNQPGPRYTSYPTAPEWQSAFPLTQVNQALVQLGQSNKTVSLYVHVPFCATMCYYCGCNVVIRKSNDQVGDVYLDYLEKEMSLVTSQIGRRVELKQFHIGGGTPNFLTIPQLTRLWTMVNHFFDWGSEPEISIEVDPRTVTHDQIRALRDMGFNRLSMGIQDFDPDVQKAVNRIQPFEQVQALIALARSVDFYSINVDLIYGLPLQTIARFSKTLDLVIQLDPDRIALYSFAHIPWLKSHQKLILDTQLPEADLKLDIFLEARKRLLAAHYDAIAMDHFAKSSDPMALAAKNGTLYRNFMGYTVKPADEFLGLGVSSIGYVSTTFIQNHHDLKTYYSRLDQHLLPIEKGKALSFDDLIRQWVITELMCHFKVDKPTFSDRFNLDFDEYFAFERISIDQCANNGLIEHAPSVIRLTELGKTFVRNVAMCFDWYFRQKNAHQRFSKTV